MAQNECGTCEYSYVGSAKVYLGKPGQPLNFIGNVNNLSIEHDLNELSLIDYTAPGGGSCSKVTRVNAINVSMDLWNLCPSNLALLTGGDYSDLPVTTVAAGAEVHDVIECGLISFDLLPDLSIPPVIESVPAGTTYVEGTDYTLTETGIIPIDGGGIADGTQISAAYTSILSKCVEAITDLSKECRMVIEGYNEANGKRIKHEFYRFRPSPTAALGIITDDFGSATISGEILSDSTKTGNAVSRYYKMTVQTGEPT